MASTEQAAALTRELAARQRSRPSGDGEIWPKVKARDRRRTRRFIEISQRRDRARDPVAVGEHFLDGPLGNECYSQSVARLKCCRP